MHGHHHENLTGEMPRSHDIQSVFMVAFFIIWLVDSFFLRLSTPAFSMLTLLLPIFPALLVLGVAVHFMRASHRDLFDTQIDGLAMGGVFGRVRHPMYLGTVLFYFGLAVLTLSLLSLAFCLLIFLLYNRLADYEERLLDERFGDEYTEYRTKVRKWVPA